MTLAGIFNRSQKVLDKLQMRSLNGFAETGNTKHLNRPLSPLNGLHGSPIPNMQWTELSASPCVPQLYLGAQYRESPLLILQKPRRYQGQSEVTNRSHAILLKEAAI